MSAPDDIAAFPNVGNSTWNLSPEMGMTLRDWFAGQALAGEMAAQGEYTGEWENDAPDGVLLSRAKFHYRFARAMMDARESEA